MGRIRRSSGLATAGSSVPRVFKVARRSTATCKAALRTAGLPAAFCREIRHHELSRGVPSVQAAPVESLQKEVWIRGELQCEPRRYVGRPAVRGDDDSCFYCSRIPASLITLPHLAISDFTAAANSFGEPPTGSTPVLKSRSLTSAVLSTRTIS